MMQVINFLWTFQCLTKHTFLRPLWPFFPHCERLKGDYRYQSLLRRVGAGKIDGAKWMHKGHNVKALILQEAGGHTQKW